MTVLRNQGELASPYFLVELWVRRGEIDIDPETYASLKRKARSLVRDSRAAEDRGDLIDDEWRERRRDLLALTGARVVEAYTEAGVLEAKVWADDEDRDCVLFVELDPGVSPEERGAVEDLTEPPATAFELALEAVPHDAEWGLLLAGTEIRLYRRASGLSQQYVALDLDSLVELDDEDHWLAFAGLFRTPAFIPDQEGVPLIRRVVDESRRHASALAEDMREDVVAAAEAIIQGALDTAANRDLLGDSPPRSVLDRLFEETLFYLYRLLFVLFAEAREMLPISGANPYATTYSVDHLVELARKPGRLSTETTYFDNALRRLFSLLWDGPREEAKSLGVDPVGGELFDPERTALLDQCTIPDHAWKRALVAVAIGGPSSTRGKLGRRSSFAELGVDQLGSIYEGLLVLEPHYVDTPKVLVRVDGERRVLERDAVGDLRVEHDLSPGAFVLESAGGRRKGSGSFYTPHEITEFLVRSRLDPILEPILAEAESDPTKAGRRILALNVCDPAMGSGAFLVQAARILGDRLARVRAKLMRRAGSVTPEEIKRAEADVVRRCLYGVDLNPLAVALAKVSLWLETLRPGEPLTFLDAHLRVGDSLIGGPLLHGNGRLTLQQVTVWPKNAVKGLKKYLNAEAGLEGKPMLEALKERRALPRREQLQLPGLDKTEVEAALDSIAREREELATAPQKGNDLLAHERDASARFQQLEAEEGSIRNRIRAVADFWCAQWFWPAEESAFEGIENGWSGVVPPPGEDAFNRIVGHLLSPKGTLTGETGRQLRVARRVALERHFFHWPLEFAEVFEHGGFDLVVGNPPWFDTTPSTTSFFRTYDVLTFRKKVPRSKQDARKDELRGDHAIDTSWRFQARWLHELSFYAKPEGGQFTWYAPEGNLRKGDANVFRLFVERAYSILRPTARFGQVLPEAIYVSLPTTGVRQRLLTDGRLEFCYVFENRKGIFPIHRSVKVTLLGGQRGTGPTEEFRAAFYVGKDAAYRDRAIGLDELPGVLADLELEAPTVTAEQIKALAPITWAFPELQTALDAEIAMQCATRHAPLNLDGNGWGLTYCRELDARGERWSLASEGELERAGANRIGLRWVSPNSERWIPVVEGEHLWGLEYPAQESVPEAWIPEQEFREVESRDNPDGSSVIDHYRVGWRKIGSATNERSAIAAVLPPLVAAKNTCLTVWGGSLPAEPALALAALMGSFCFDYLHRVRGTTDLTYGVVDSTPAPPLGALRSIVPAVAEAVCISGEFDGLWTAVMGDGPRPELGGWEWGEKRADVDAFVAKAYGVSLMQYAAVLSSFPLLDRIQPMISSEPKSFVTRDVALLAFCRLLGEEPPDMPKLLKMIGVELPLPPKEYRRLDARVERYRELGAVPYRPTPKGGRVPDDPALVEAVRGLLSVEATSAEEIAERLDEDKETVSSILKKLARQGEDVFASGRGKNRRYYVMEN